MNPSLGQQSQQAPGGFSLGVGGGNKSDHLDERQLALESLEKCDEELRQTCQGLAKTFVSVERRQSVFTAELKHLLERLEQLDSLEQLQFELGNEEEKAEDETITPAAVMLPRLSQTHQLRRRTLLQHSTLLELLELPNVMDACIRSQLYDDALQVASFANTLQQRHPDSNILQQVVQEVRSRETELRQQVLQQLETTDLSMAQCLELVTALRRLNNIVLERRGGSSTSGGKSMEQRHTTMELQLQVDFLEARDRWLDKKDNASNLFAAARKEDGGGGRGAPSSDQNTFLNWMNRHRTKCFDICTQFLAVFCSGNTKAEEATGGDYTGTPRSLLSMWWTRQMHSFLTIWDKELERHSSISALRDVLDAAMFFAASMGRLGGDFTPLLLQMMQGRVLTLVKQSWNDAVNTLDETLKVCRDAGVASPLRNEAIEMQTESRSGSLASKEENDDYMLLLSPPRCLLALPPLARVVNAILLSCNDLRRLLMPSTFGALQKHLHHLFHVLDVLLETNERKVMTPGMLRGEAAQLRELAPLYKQQLQDVVKPFLDQALQLALGYSAENEEVEQVEEETAEEEEEKADHVADANDGNENQQGDEEANSGLEVDSELPVEEEADPNEENNDELPSALDRSSYVTE